MAKVSLGSMLGNVEAAKASPVEPATEASPATLAAVPAAPATPARPTQPKKPAKRAPAPKVEVDQDGPRYLQLTRKETRLTDEQLEDLAVLTRRLNKARKGTGERLTDNSLIRVAVDLLLSRQDRLAGSTEDELRKSVGLELTES